MTGWGTWRRPLPPGWNRRGGGTDIGLFAAAVASLVLLGPAPAHANQATPPGSGAAPGVAVTRAGSQPSARGPEANFTGSVRVDAPFRASAPARVSGVSVTFEPGARTAWHTHPLGQTLVVTAGSGRVQREGGAIEDIRPGDVVWFPPGEKHWHGAAATTAMSHIAVQEKQDGSPVEWLEQVSEADYLG